MSFFIILWPISRFATFLARVLLRLVGVKMDEKESDGTFTRVDLDHLVQSTIENAKNEDEIEDEVKIFQMPWNFKIRKCVIAWCHVLRLRLLKRIARSKNYSKCS